MPSKPCLDATASCVICGRSAMHTTMHLTAFGEPQTTGPFFKAVPNENWKEYPICSSDLTLFYRIKKTPEGKSLSTNQIIDEARKYRLTHPVKSL